MFLYANFLICNFFQPSDNCVSGLGQFEHTVTCTRTDGKEPVSEHIGEQQSLTTNCQQEKICNFIIRFTRHFL